MRAMTREFISFLLPSFPFPSPPKNERKKRPAIPPVTPISSGKFEGKYNMLYLRLGIYTYSQTLSSLFQEIFFIG
jgi:hypothetical protein